MTYNYVIRYFYFLSIINIFAENNTRIRIKFYIILHLVVGKVWFPIKNLNRNKILIIVWYIPVFISLLQMNLRNCQMQEFFSNLILFKLLRKIILHIIQNYLSPPLFMLASIVCYQSEVFSLRHTEEKTIHGTVEWPQKLCARIIDLFSCSRLILRLWSHWRITKIREKTMESEAVISRISYSR